jgi:hypothetical protein
MTRKSLDNSKKYLTKRLDTPGQRAYTPLKTIAPFKGIVFL